MRRKQMTIQRTASAARRVRGFNLVELLIALGITSTLLTATLVALNASFMSYQSTTEVASTHTIGRLTMYRLMALIRTGHEFGPVPANPLDRFIESDWVQFTAESGDVLTVEWVPAEEALYLRVADADTGVEESNLLLEGVIAQVDEDGEPVSPFTLEYEKGRHLYRATVDLAVVPDDNMDVSLDGDNTESIRLVASAMPRVSAY